MTINNIEKQNKYLNKIQFDVEVHLSLIVPVVEYIATTSVTFRHKMKQQHMTIVKEFTKLLGYSIDNNGEDNVYKYVDIQNDFIDALCNVADHKQFNTDLRKAIKRQGINYFGDHELKTNQEYQVNNSELARYYDCLLYIISQYSSIRDIQLNNTAVNVTAYKVNIYNTLFKQCEMIAKQIGYIGNPYTVNSMLYYIVAKSDLKDKSTVFDNEVKMILEKNV